LSIFATRVVNATYSDITHFSERCIEDFSSHGNLACSATLVVGIASGGIPLAKEVHRQLHADADAADYMEVRCCRPSTKSKEEGAPSKLFALVFRLPYFLLNILRLIEHGLLASRSNSGRTIEIQGDLSTKAYKWVLIVDDAVDSGYSMSCVVDYLRENLAATPTLLTASYVVTRNSPVYRPDFTLFNNVLVRFPWAKDAKK
jgi:hypoxanthine-guanine phosphoribosyltransferase